MARGLLLVATRPVPTRPAFSVSGWLSLSDSTLLLLPHLRPPLPESSVWAPQLHLFTWLLANQCFINNTHNSQQFYKTLKVGRWDQFGPMEATKTRVSHGGPLLNLSKQVGAGGSWVKGQPGLQNQTLSERKKGGKILALKETRRSALDTWNKRQKTKRKPKKSY